jgi:hypothetical protein
MESAAITTRRVKGIEGKAAFGVKESKANRVTS